MDKKKEIRKHHQQLAWTVIVIHISVTISVIYGFV